MNSSQILEVVFAQFMETCEAQSSEDAFSRAEIILKEFEPQSVEKGTSLTFKITFQLNEQPLSFKIYV